VTLLLLAFSEVIGTSGEDAFLQRFTESARLMREQAFAPYAPTAAYSAMVLGLMRLRPFDGFLVMDGDRVRGRIAVEELSAKSKAAGAGLFEAAAGADRDRISGMLISAAERWASREGYSEVFAPIDFNTWFSYRFLLPREDGAPHSRLFSWEPVQPGGYLEEFVRAGFAEMERYRTVVMRFDPQSASSLSNVAHLTSSAVSSATESGFIFDRLSDRAQLAAILDEAYEICMSAFAENLLFEPVSRELFRTILLSGAAVRDCTLSHWVRDESGEMAGFLLAFSDGDSVVAKTIAIAPSARGHRLSTALIHLAVKEGAARGLDTFVSALVRSGNVSESLSGPFADRCAEKEIHEYVLLQKVISEFTDHGGVP
jgi:GNAT superfamily N-acetyltransferase